MTSFFIEVTRKVDMTQLHDSKKTVSSSLIPKTVDPNNAFGLYNVNKTHSGNLLYK